MSKAEVYKKYSYLKEADADVKAEALENIEGDIAFCEEKIKAPEQPFTPKERGLLVALCLFLCLVFVKFVASVGRCLRYLYLYYEYDGVSPSFGKQAALMAISVSVVVFIVSMLEHNKRVRDISRKVLVATTVVLFLIALLLAAITSSSGVFIEPVKRSIDSLVLWTAIVCVPTIAASFLGQVLLDRSLLIDYKERLDELKYAKELLERWQQ